MPYILRDIRKVLQEGKRSPENVGELNYVISVILLRWLADEGISYTNINSVIGVLECCKSEIYRRVAVPYEKLKIEENGDLDIFTDFDNTISNRRADVQH